MLQNKKIKSLKKYISAWEGMEYVEYWEDGGEGSVYLAELLATFKSADWVELKEGLKNWKDNALMILADCLLDHGHFDNQDSAKLYGYIFTIINDNEADLLIDNIKFIDTSNTIDSELLEAIYEKAINVANYPNTIKTKQDFDEIISDLKKKKELAKSKSH